MDSNITRRPVPDQSTEGEARDSTERIAHKARGWLRDQHEIPLVGVKVPGWTIVIPALGYFLGGTTGKILNNLALTEGLMKAIGATSWEGIGSAAGIFLALWMWLSLKNRLGFERTTALLAGSTLAAVSVDGILSEGPTDTTIFGALVAALIFAFYGEIRDWAARTLNVAEMIINLALLIVVGVVVISPWLGFFGIPNLSQIFGQLFGKGLGFVEAALVFLALWHWR